MTASSSEDEASAEIDQSSVGLQTETSVDPDSEVERERQRQKAAKHANVWGSLVTVMYGIDKENDMKMKFYISVIMLWFWRNCVQLVSEGLGLGCLLSHSCSSACD